MTPAEVLDRWIAAFNAADIDALATLYHDDAINHQVAKAPVTGRNAIAAMFAAEFSAAPWMHCLPLNRMADGEWAAMEWRDPKGFQGCGFFHVVDGRIALQRGYWDRLSFERLYGISSG
ncbi:nuclear transport factor 2 family protein [Sphingomonas sp. DT-204]|uniref:nuclear transport factor 2 family protein n=1 Tax=Sphingomonas sp. DT-204 TaxID=3396166 RepID=UPI003F1DBD9D